MRNPLTNRAAAASLTFAIITLIVTYFYLTGPARVARPVFPLGLVPSSACDDGGDRLDDTAERGVAIPNIVHYVWLLNDPEELRLNFKAFISIYSAHILWQPERIYIHTDATPEVYNKAQLSGTPWTRRILAIPGITPNYIDAPRSTTKGVEIKHVEHRADFLRITALRDLGGVYLDMDAVPLRDITDLRNSGFANVLGGATALSTKHSGYINNGVMMSQPHSTLMKLYYLAAHEFFDGAWSTASIHVLTDLANRLVSIPREVLILQPQAFAPTSWEFEDQKRLFLPALTSPGPGEERSPDPTQPTCRDVLEQLRRQDDRTDTWELDFSSTYVIHAFDDYVEKISGWDHDVSVKYVLERRSNYARAVFPAVWHAVQAGIIPQDETN